jgi:hypothetical protein
MTFFRGGVTIMNYISATYIFQKVLLVPRLHNDGYLKEAIITFLKFFVHIESFFLANLVTIAVFNILSNNKPTEQTRHNKGFAKKW